ncbi:hypothetical protein IJH24_02225 [Candidatus Saccharibacteria bacterium]|nr:hypothetical protein [Candidatus Saccharibacteria bacterium]
MVKQKTKVIFRIACFLAMELLFFAQINPVSAASGNTDLYVDVREVLSVSITTPTTWASGNVDTFLRNAVHLDVVTNNANGFTASMTMKTNNTSLVNTTKSTATLPTLSASTTRTNFPANYWGYSLDDTVAGNGSSTYNALVGASSNPITILSSNSASSGSKDFYFGAKANVTKASGTYSGTVVISVVTGIVDNNNPATPTYPDGPNPIPDTPSYNPLHQTTTYTHTTTNSGAGTSTTTTEVSAYDNRSAYGVVSQNPSLGVTYSTASNVSSLSAMTTGLAIASSVAMTSGAFFLFAARREEDDDEEEDDNNDDEF